MGFKWVVQRIQDLFKRLDYRRWSAEGCFVVGYRNTGDQVYLVTVEEDSVSGRREIKEE